MTTIDNPLAPLEGFKIIRGDSPPPTRRGNGLTANGNRKFLRRNALFSIDLWRFATSLHREGCLADRVATAMDNFKSRLAKITH